MTDEPDLSAPEVNELIARASRVWRSSQVVFESASWQGQPEARAVAEEIAEKHPELEQNLINLSSDADQLVAAYALLTLDLMGSNQLQHLPPDLLRRSSKITLSEGSFRSQTTLGSFAKQLQKQSLARAGRQHRE